MSITTLPKKPRKDGYEPTDFPLRIVVADGESYDTVISRVSTDLEQFYGTARRGGSSGLSFSVMYVFADAPGVSLLVNELSGSDGEVLLFQLRLPPPESKEFDPVPYYSLTKTEWAEHLQAFAVLVSKVDDLKKSVAAVLSHEPKG